jgi:hypothetical protein
MVNIALGIRPIDDCPNGEVHEDGEISIDEIIIAVGTALSACPL